MFQSAYATTRKYTRPVIISTKTIGGECSSSIGTFVIVNEEGWIITASHILESCAKKSQEANETKELQAKYEKIRNDSSLNKKEKKKLYSMLKKTKNTDIERFSAWWGEDGLVLDQMAGNEAIDIGVGKLVNFKPADDQKYPIFKDSTKNYTPGKSLCKLGFPFHGIKPAWNDKLQAFELPSGSIPVPIFPIDGIFTREIHVQVKDLANAPPYPLKWVETSTPGLRGQSGGPIFDQDGFIWAIQANTAHYPLGFNPKAPGSNQAEHQFLNAGRGVHTETIASFLDENNISYQLSDQ